MDIDSPVSDLRGTESGSDDLRRNSTHSEPLKIRELLIRDPGEMARILTAYASVDVPREPGDIFLDHLTRRRDSWFVEVEDTGLVYLTSIIPRYMGNLNVIFWDGKLPAVRVPVVRAVVKKAVQLFQLQKVNASTPARPLGEFLKKVGFRWEGTIRRGMALNGRTVDLSLFGALDEEVMEWP